MNESLNLYINFLLYAIVGRMGEADSLLRRFKREIYEAAAHSLRGCVAPTLVFRGVLLDPEQDVRDYKLKHDDRLTFLSFSRNLDVAKWFADVDSIMSGYVKQVRPNVQGFLTEYSPDPTDVLFYAKAQPTLCKVLALAADMHPDIEPTQLKWNLATQDEVILKPVPGPLTVTPYKPEDTWRLDLQFTHPMFRE